ncbi:MAG: NAD(P)-dependent alcohol dehydrogenase [Myxococcota bacterium]
MHAVRIEDPEPQNPEAREAVAAPARTMRAMLHERDGSFDGLRLREIPTPTPGKGEVLVRVAAAGLHVADCFGVRGSPFVMRMAVGLFRPKLGIPGFDLAGRVAAVGEGVRRFRVGDAVFGECAGSCADYVCASQERLALKPEGLSFAEAASVPTSALAALHGLRDAAKLEAGQRLLINGASGGVGTFAVQIAVSLGAKVTGVCSTGNVELVRGLGADEVIDYTRGDFTDGPSKYDVVFDNVENRSLSAVRRALTPKGTAVFNSGTGATGLRMLTRLLAPVVLSPFVGHKLRRYLSMPNHDDLVVLKEMVESGRLRPVIDRTVSLVEVPEALEYIESGRARGKVVVTVAASASLG